MRYRCRHCGDEIERTKDGWQTAGGDDWVVGEPDYCAVAKGQHELVAEA